jgi:hypothetical protein
MPPVQGDVQSYCYTRTTADEEGHIKGLQMCSHQGEYIDGYATQLNLELASALPPLPPQDPAASVAWHLKNGLALPDHLQTESGSTHKGPDPPSRICPPIPQVLPRWTLGLRLPRTPTSQWGTPRTYWTLSDQS